MMMLMNLLKRSSMVYQWFDLVQLSLRKESNNML